MFDYRLDISSGNGMKNAAAAGAIIQHSKMNSMNMIIIAGLEV